MKKRLATACLLFCFTAAAQDSAQRPPLTFSGYAEIYYGYDFNKPADNNRPSFVYSHNRHNEFNANLAYLKGSYAAGNTRAALALATGSYMNANYAAEPGVLKNVYEATAGAKILKKKALWLDAGILPSHIGAESARAADCWTPTRSLVAETSPYFESGAKLTYTTDNGKWLLAALALNGWQRIRRLPGNSLMSWGTQVQYKPSGSVTLNYSTFAGTDKPDSARAWRYFHNLYALLQLSRQWGLLLDVDFGQEQKAKGSSRYNHWYGTVVVWQFKPTPSWAVALRGEYYGDKRGVIVYTGTPDGLTLFGASLNVDKAIAANFLWRMEIKAWHSRDAIFPERAGFVRNNDAITASLAISF